jgi:hypothetical protein
MHAVYVFSEFLPRSCLLIPLERRAQERRLAANHVEPQVVHRWAPYRPATDPPVAPDHPVAPAAAAAAAADGPHAPIAYLRQCRRCRRHLPPDVFVGLSGRTTLTCGECLVCFLPPSLPR